ncbi:MAG: hypothetical protein LBT75_00375, partial [Bacilli bacterium]|nr:hypothetical protein [Bacilli bacterium]
PVNYSINATYFKVSISAGKTYEIVKDIINTYLLGNVELLKNANDIDLYTKTIHKDETTPYYASKDGGMVIYEYGNKKSIEMMLSFLNFFKYII